MNAIEQQLWTLRDEPYAQFSAKLNPTIPAEKFIGVRVPELRKLAAKLVSEGAHMPFLESLPHRYFEENLLHSILLCKIKDFNLLVQMVETFLPEIDNWAVCDTLSPKIFVKHRPQLLPYLQTWMASTHEFTIRAGIHLLMDFYLDEGFQPQYLALPAQVESDDYYVRMMVAWFYATALAKQWESTIPYLSNRQLPAWTHNKTIQKACESYRISPEQKAFLRTLRL